MTGGSGGKYTLSSKVLNEMSTGKDLAARHLLLHRAQISDQESLLIIGPAGNILWSQRMTVVFTQVSLGSGQFNIGDDLLF